MLNKMMSKERRTSISAIVQSTRRPSWRPTCRVEHRDFTAQGQAQCKSRSKQLPKAVINVSSVLASLIFVMKENGS
jgi:hypothetical protein